MRRFEARLRTAEPELRELIGRIPLQQSPPLPPEWLRCEAFERYAILRGTPLPEAGTVIEVGSGGHAIATLPLALRAGPAGRVVAVERSRWTQFRSIVAASGLGGRIFPVAADARSLPLCDDAAEVAVCLHGVRSLRGADNLVRVVREMLRVAPRAVLAESLPLARTDAQRAHLAMYDLRQELFAATTGVRDDLPYLSLDALRSSVEAAGGAVERAEVMEVDLPHFLARFPRDAAERIADPVVREALLRRWDAADSMLRRFGEDHPPVGVVSAVRP
jgi:hypothetical protein